MLREVNQLAGYEIDDLVPIFFFAMLNDMLCHVVAVLVYDECVRAGVKFLEDGSLCLALAVLKHPLDDSTAIRMGRQAMNLTSEGIDDELDMLRWNSLDGFLNYVVAILVLDAFQDVHVELFDQSGLLVDQDMLKCLYWSVMRMTGHSHRSTYLLHHPATIHLQREIQNVAFHLLCKDCLLLLRAMFEELLNHVISKHVGHKL